jgi:hypothetical protein
MQAKQHICDQIIYPSHLVFTSMFKFLDLNLKSMHVLSHICFFLPNILGLVIHFNGPLCKFNRCIIGSLGYLVIENNILANFWKCMSQASSIKRFKHPQTIIRNNLFQRRCTCLQNGPFVIYIYHNFLGKK